MKKSVKSTLLISVIIGLIIIVSGAASLNTLRVVVFGLGLLTLTVAIFFKKWFSRNSEKEAIIYAVIGALICLICLLYTIAKMSK